MFLRARKQLVALLTLCLILSSFNMVTAATVSASDVETSWAASTLKDWIAKGWISGYPDGTIKPNHKVSRAEFATIMNKALGLQKKGNIQFSDLPSGNWEYEQMGIAVEEGYIQGYKDGTIRPRQEVSRQEAAMMIAAFYKLDTTQGSTAKLTDAAKIADWSKGAVGAVVSKGIMKGYPDGSFRPDQPITRAEAVVLISAALKTVAATENKDPAKPTPVPTSSPKPTPTPSPKPAQTTNPTSTSTPVIIPVPTPTPTPPITPTPTPTVTEPTASVSSGSVASGTAVTFSTATAGATIYYTLDGSEPSVTNGTLGSTVNVNGQINDVVTVKVIAVKSGMKDSPIVTFTYTIVDKVAIPTVELTKGGYPVAGPDVPTDTRIQFSSNTPGATFYYEIIGGTAPTQGQGASTDIKGNIGQTVILRVYASKTGMVSSDIVTFTYTIKAQVNSLFLAVDSPFYVSNIPAQGRTYIVHNNTMINFRSHTSDATIHYQINGGAEQTGPDITLTGNPEPDTIFMKVTAKHPDMVDYTNHFSFRIADEIDNLAVEPGTLPGSTKINDCSNPAAHKCMYKLYDSSQQVELFWDEIIPTRFKDVDSNDIPANPGDKLVIVSLEQSSGKVVGFNVVKLDSSNVSLETVKTPTASISSGATIGNNTNITLSTDTVGATIYYTTNGTVPSDLNGIQGNTVTIMGSHDDNVTVKAIAVKAGMDNSTVAEFTYTITNQVAAPTANIASGSNVINGGAIIFSSATGPVDFCIKVNTTDKGCGPLAQVNITGSENELVTIEVYAKKTGMLSSDSVTFTYKIKEATVVSPEVTLPYGAILPSNVTNNFNVANNTVITLNSSISGATYMYQIGGLTGSGITGDTTVNVSGNPGDIVILEIVISHPDMASNTGIYHFKITEEIADTDYEVMPGTNTGTRIESINYSGANKFKFRTYKPSDTPYAIWDKKVALDYQEWSVSTDNISAEDGGILVIVALNSANEVIAFQIIDLKAGFNIKQ